LFQFLKTNHDKAAVVEALVQRLAKELANIEAKLPDRPSLNSNPGEGEVPSTPIPDNTPDVTTPSIEVRSEPFLGAPDPSTELESGGWSSSLPAICSLRSYSSQMGRLRKI
jgi:hypothetical protein